MEATLINGEVIKKEEIFIRVNKHIYNINCLYLFYIYYIVY